MYLQEVRNCYLFYGNYLDFSNFKDAVKYEGMVQDKRVTHFRSKIDSDEDLDLDIVLPDLV